MVDSNIVGSRSCRLRCNCCRILALVVRLLLVNKIAGLFSLFFSNPSRISIGQGRSSLFRFGFAFLGLKDILVLGSSSLVDLRQTKGFPPLVVSNLSLVGFGRLAKVFRLVDGSKGLREAPGNHFVIRWQEGVFSAALMSSGYRGRPRCIATMIVFWFI